MLSIGLGVVSELQSRRWALDEPDDAQPGAAVSALLPDNAADVDVGERRKLDRRRGVLVAVAEQRHELLHFEKQMVDGVVGHGRDEDAHRPPITSSKGCADGQPAMQRTVSRGTAEA